MMKNLLEIIRKKEVLYLEEHPTKTNDYSTWDLLTLVGSLEACVPRVQKRVSILRLSLAGVAVPWNALEAIPPVRLRDEHPCHFPVSWGNPGRRSLALVHSLAHSGGWKGKCALSGSVPYARSATRCPWTERSFRSAEETVRRSRCTSLWGSSLMGGGRSWVSGCSGLRGRAPKNEGGAQGPLAAGHKKGEDLHYG